MKKIMFNDKYGLTKAVLAGEKTMTRRIVPARMAAALESVTDREFFNFAACIYSPYKPGEEVAVAQSYYDICAGRNICRSFPGAFRERAWQKGFGQHHKGCRNKMFVSALDMPFRVRIDSVSIERLQDISDADCLAEGVVRYSAHEYAVEGIPVPGSRLANGAYIQNVFRTPQDACAELIDRISGKGTWDRNPFVFVIKFQLLETLF